MNIIWALGIWGGGGWALQMDKSIIKIEAFSGKQEHNIWYESLGNTILKAIGPRKNLPPIWISIPKTWKVVNSNKIARKKMHHMILY